MEYGMETEEGKRARGERGRETGVVEKETAAPAGGLQNSSVLK